MSTTASGFYVTGGTLRQDSRSYVERQADKDLYEGLTRGEFCYVLTSRQMGKSSLMVHTAGRLRAAGAAVAIIDLTALGQTLSIEQWYGGLLRRVGQQLDPRGDLEEQLEEFWFDEETRVGPLERWMSALERVVLPAIGARGEGPGVQGRGQGSGVRGQEGQRPRDDSAIVFPDPRPPTPGAPQIVIFLDEIDAVRSLPFSTDEFFAAIRECYNRRAQDSEFDRLTFCLLGVATPSDLIRDTRMTPFNIGRRIELTDFTEAEAAPLAAGLGVRCSVLGVRADPTDPTDPNTEHRTPSTEHPTPNTQHLLQRILYWTGGHPYLTQRLCQSIAAAVTGGQGEGETGGGGDGATGKIKEGPACGAVVVGSPPPPLAPSPPLPLPPSVADVDRLCEELFFSPRARERDDNLIFVRERLLRSEADRASVLDLYGRIRQGKRVKDDETSLLIDFLRLSGIVRVESKREKAGVRGQRSGVRRAFRTRPLTPDPRPLPFPFCLPEGSLRVRNRIYARVFDREWVAQQMPDAELRRQQAAYRRGLIRAGSLAAVIVAVMAGLTATALTMAHRSRVASAAALRSGRAALRSQQLALGQARRAEGERMRADQKAAEAKRAQGKAETAGRAERAQKQIADANAQTAQTEAQRAKAAAKGEHEARLHTVELLAQSQAERGVKRLEDNDGLGLIDLIRAYQTAAPLPELKEAIGTLWAGWHQACAGRLISEVGHDRAINAVAFSPDGKLLATASDDQTVRLWDTRTWQLAAPPLQHDAAVSLIRFSPDGKLLATAAGNKAWLWDVATGARRGGPLRHDGPITSLAFSPDERLLAGGSSDRTARIWDVATGRLRGLPLDPDRGTPRSLATYSDVQVGFGPGPKSLLVAATGMSVSQWDPETGQSRGPLQRHGYISPADPALARDRDGSVRAIASHGMLWLWDPARHAFSDQPLRLAESVDGLALSPDGSFLGTAGTTERVVHLLDSATGKPVGPPFPHLAGVNALALGPRESRLLVTVSRGVVRLWDTSSGQPYADQLPAPEDVISPLLALSPDSRTLATGVTNGTIDVWATGARSPCRLLPHSSGASCMAFREDGAALASYSAEGLRLCSLDTGRPLGRRAGVLGHDLAVAFSEDGQVLVTLAGKNGGVSIWRTGAGQLRGRTLEAGQRVRSAALSRRGAVLAAITAADTVQLWDTASGRRRGGPLRHPPSVRKLAFSADESLLATAGGDSVCLWDTATGRLRVPPIRFPTAPRWLVFRPDSRVLAIAGGDAVTFRSAATGWPCLRPLEHPSPVTSGAFSPDGKWLATITQENAARLWGLASGRPRGQPMRETDRVFEARFSPDGKSLATCSMSGVRLWDTVTCLPVGRPLLAGKPVWEARFSPNGKLLALRAREGIYLWRLPVAPASLPAMKRLTAVALGVAPDPGGSAAALSWRAWRRLTREAQGPHAP